MLATATAKTCSACGSEKPHAEFARDRTRPDGLTYWCRECRNSIRRDRYQPADVPFHFKQWGEFREAAAGETPSGAFENGPALVKLGKKKSGRVLDGRTHDEMPAHGGIG